MLSSYSYRENYEMHRTVPLIGEWFEQDYKENIFLVHVIFLFVLTRLFQMMIITCVKYCLYCFVQGLRSFLTREQKQILKQPNLTMTRVFIVIKVIFSAWEIDQNKTIMGSHNTCFEGDLLCISVNDHCWLKYKF